MRDNKLNFLYDKISDLKKMLKANIYDNYNKIEPQRYT